MKTVDMSEGPHSLNELLALAKSGTVLIHSTTGEDFILEQADDFDREVASLGASEKFAAFLDARSRESGDVGIKELRERRGNRN
jgi:hypothetical protein